MSLWGMWRWINQKNLPSKSLPSTWDVRFKYTGSEGLLGCLRRCWRNSVKTQSLRSERLLRARGSQGASLKGIPSPERTFQSLTSPSSKFCHFSHFLMTLLFFFVTYCDIYNYSFICMTHGLIVFPLELKFHDSKGILFIVITNTSLTFN